MWSLLLIVSLPVLVSLGGCETYPKTIVIRPDPNVIAVALRQTHSLLVRPLPICGVFRALSAKGGEPQKVRSNDYNWTPTARLLVVDTRESLQHLGEKLMPAWFAGDGHSCSKRVVVSAQITHIEHALGAGSFGLNQANEAVTLKFRAHFSVVDKDLIDVTFSAACWSAWTIMPKKLVRFYNETFLSAVAYSLDLGFRRLHERLYPETQRLVLPSARRCHAGRFIKVIPGKPHEPKVSTSTLDK